MDRRRWISCAVAGMAVLGGIVITWRMVQDNRRTHAKAAAQLAGDARSHAMDVQAPAFANALWVAAQSMNEEAEMSFAAKHFLDARRGWQEAEQIYRQAVQRAESKLRLRKALEYFDLTLQKTAAIPFERFGGPFWQERLEAAIDSETAGDWNAASVAYMEAAAILTAAYEACVQHYLMQVAEIDAPEHKKAALALLDELLAFAPSDIEALSLRKKIAAYPRIIIVPDELGSIKDAMAAASEGDIVRVKEGVYEGGWIRFKNGVQLLGDGMDVVTVHHDVSMPVMLVENCTSGLISKIRFEHTGVADTYGRHPVVTVKNSSLKITHCRVTNGAGSGLAISEGSNVLITDCVMDGNTWMGLQADDEHTEVTIRSSRFHHNKQFGIYIGSRAKAVVEDNIGDQNGFSGMFVRHAGTSAQIRNNTFKNNRRAGIHFGAGGGVAESNTCTHNNHTGILVIGDGDVILRNNRCSHNGQNLRFLKGSKAIAENNTCEYSTNSSVAVEDENTAPILRDNELKHSGKNGICFANGAGGLAENNLLEMNKWSGIAVSGEKSRPVLRNNSFNDNGKLEMEYLEGAQPTDDPTDAPREEQD